MARSACSSSFSAWSHHVDRMCNHFVGNRVLPPFAGLLELDSNITTKTCPVWWLFRSAVWMTMISAPPYKIFKYLKLLSPDPHWEPFLSISSKRRGLQSNLKNLRSFSGDRLSTEEIQFVASLLLHAPSTSRNRNQCSQCSLCMQLMAEFFRISDERSLTPLCTAARFVR